jgi:GntR family transcriptional repressor for pyruvate dehydrogenase complex
MFLPVETREPISELIALQIEEAILTRVYLPGSKLPSESELCKQFNVSRTSVREALRTLHAQGLIKITKGIGIFVNDANSKSVVDPLTKYLKLKLDRNYVLDLIHARQIIEPGVAYYASKNRSKEDLKQLDLVLDDLDKCNGDFIDLAKLDMTFHLNLAKASKNSVIPLILDPIQRLIPELSSVYATVSNAKEIAQKWHRKIFEAVADKSGEKARRAMIQHLKIAEEHAEKMLEHHTE